MSSARLDLLREIERKVQAKWETDGTLETRAATDGSMRPKFLVTFPFTCMNGRLNLDHGFALTRAEFAARFWRMQGREVLWPFGLHTTLGQHTPIAAYAQKLGGEIAKYGCPPVFPDTELMVEKEASRPEKSQWQILQSMGIPDKEIPKFADPLHWLNYFLNLTVEDLKLFGAHIDWRRSFVTTDVNPFFGSFVKWQLQRLHGYLGIGKRYCVYSPRDGQPCADHDRAIGEGVLPQGYTLVKLTVQGATNLPTFADFKDIIGDKDVILPGATLHAETVVGLTNCWVSPWLKYKAYEITNADGRKEIFLMTAHAARNLTYQEVIVNGTLKTDLCPLFEVEGAKIVGVPLSAPCAPYSTVYALPMSAVSETKGTGVLISVPAHSPEDYINFSELFNDPDYRAKLSIKDEWVVPFKIVPIINIPNSQMGLNVAKFGITKLGVNGPNDSDKLKEAEQIARKASFDKGVMITGPFAGLKVSEARVKMAKFLLDSGMALRYFEPSKEVITCSGDVCVVAFCEQWLLEYSFEEWKSIIGEHLASMEMYFPGIHHGFEESIKRLSEWSCAPALGLGTQLPWLVVMMLIKDSLSDSTTQMAYFTVAHYFHTASDGCMSPNATAPNAYGITPSMVSDAFWDYVLYGEGSPEALNAASGIPVETARYVRDELAYWYPVDLRVSTKDLTQSHLTSLLYNHAAIWPNEKNLWPRSIYCNGHIMVDNQKMSTSLGNFITLGEAVHTYGADSTRLACADAGDNMETANFVRAAATGFVIRLTALIEQIKDLRAKRLTFRKGEMNIHDRIMGDFVNGTVESTTNYFIKMSFRMALRSAYFQLTAKFNQYKLNCSENNMHISIVERFAETIVLLLQPFAPHATEYIWSEVLGHTTPAAATAFPIAEPTDYGLFVSSRLISGVVKSLRKRIAKSIKKRGPLDEMFVYVSSTYPSWQTAALATLRAIYEENNKSLPYDTAKLFVLRKEPWMTNDNMQDAMAFVAFTKGNYARFGHIVLSDTPIVDDQALLSSVADHIAKRVGVRITILPCDDTLYDEHKAAKSKARPGGPSIASPPLGKQ